jgi:hypothetical protein
MADETAAGFSGPGLRQRGLRQPLIGPVGPVDRVTVTSMDFFENPHTSLDLGISPPPDPSQPVTFDASVALQNASLLRARSVTS